MNNKQADATIAEDIRAFLHWTVHSGQDGTTYLDAVDFQPLPSGGSDAVRQPDRQDRRLSRWPHQRLC